MENQLIITCVILGIALVLFLSGRLAADLVALLVVVALGLTGVLTPAEAFSGFSRSAVIVIISIFVLTESLQRTGVTEQVGNILLKVGGTGELRLTIVVMIAGAFLSLFMNNIASAAVLLPAMSGLAKRSGVNTSRLLIPLAFSTILGGTATLFTTSNIILNSVLRDNELPVFGLTDFGYVGLPIVVVGILYVAFIGRNSLPGESPLERTHMPSSDRGDLIEAYGLGAMLFKARVPDGSMLIDRTIAECTLREDYDINIVGIEREGKRILHPTPQRHIRRGDILVLEGDEADFRKRDIEPFMEFLPETEWHESDLESPAIDVVEAMLPPRSRLIGKTIRDAHFREKYGMSVLAIWHGDREVIMDLGDEKLHFGDALLLQGPREKLHVMKDDPDILLLASDEEVEITVPGKGRAALMIFFGTLGLAAFLPDLTAAIMLGGALAMVVVRIITTEQAYSAIGWKSVFLVAGMLPMGDALSKTNAAGYAAQGLLHMLGGYGPYIIVAALFIVTAIATQMINGAVTAAIIGPVAVQLAHQTGVDPRALIMAVAMACSMAFITPLSHAVNVLVMSPGGYNFKDYMKVGVPLTAVLFVVVMVVLPFAWPF